MSDKLSEKEFLDRLREDKFHENPEEHINYRLPAVQYYLDKFVQINGQPINVTIVYRAEDFTLVNYAFDSIKNNPFIKQKLITNS